MPAVARPLMAGAIVDELMPFLGLAVGDATRRLALEYGTLDAKDPGKEAGKEAGAEAGKRSGMEAAGGGGSAPKLYRSRRPSAAARRWSVAYAALTYATLRYGAQNETALEAAREAAAAALADEASGEGRMVHSAGVGQAMLARNCPIRPEDGWAWTVKGASETGMRLWTRGDLLGAEVRLAIHADPIGSQLIPF